MFLGIDCGTQGTKCLLVDDQGQVHGRGFAAHDLIERASGAREQEPAWWVDALCSAVKQAISQHPGVEVKALGVSGQQHGLVLLDEAFQVIRPAKLWNDTETAPENAQIIAALGGSKRCFERFGIVPLTGYTVSKLMWVSKHEPENFARVRHILLPHEYLNFYLTGKLAAEYGDASGTAFFNVRTRRWAGDVLHVIDKGTGQLEHALPPLLPAEAVVGPLLPAVAAELGLPVTCVVSTGGGDNMMGAIGTGNVRPGVVTMSLGTSSTVYSFRSEPSRDNTGNVAAFCSSSGGWLPLVCTMNATNVVTQVLNTLGKTVADLDNMLNATPPGADGLCFIPFLNGERTPDLPHARGSLVGISPLNLTPAHLVRAAVEGVSFGMLHGLSLVLEGDSASEIFIVGGGAKSEAWRQLLADATGATLQMPAEIEAGCLGAAMQAMYAYGHAQGHPESFTTIADRCVRVQNGSVSLPRPELRNAYRAAFARYLSVRDTFYEERR